MEELFSAYEEVRQSGLFDARYYVATYPDVAQRAIDPLVHYLEEGAREGRNPCADFDSRFYLEQCGLRGEEPDNPLLHYIRIGAARGFKTRRDKAVREVAADKPAPTTDRAGQPPILIAIEALGVIGLPEGKSRLSVSGWALAAAPIAEITASLDATFAGTATYGLPRPGVARLYPDRAAAAHCGFILGLDVPSSQRGAIAPILTVRTQDGEIGHHPLQVEIPPQGVSADMVAPAEAAGAGAADPGATLMQLRIDAATVDTAGLLRLQGWVVCRVQIEAVDVFIGSARLGAAEFGHVRADIEKLHPDYPNSGFAGFLLVADISGYGSGRKTIAVRATARTGITREAAVEVAVARMRAKAAADPGLHYHCDEITLTTEGHLALKGWAVSGSATRSIAVLLDGNAVGRAELGLERPDIGNLFPALAHARQSGFAFEAQTGKAAAGAHLITLRIRREDGKTDEARVPVAANAQQRPGIAPPLGDRDPQLHIDTPFVIDGAAEAPVRGNLEIDGWALAKAGIAAIEITIDGTLRALAECGLRRLDIQAAFPGRADALSSGYQALLPHRTLPKGNHQVRVTLRDLAGGTTSTEFAIAVEDLSAVSGPWALRRKMGQAEIDLYRHILEQSGRHPLFVVMLRVDQDEASLHRAGATIDSLSAQAYPHWRLAIVPGRSGRKSGTIRDRLLAGRPGLIDRAEVCPNLAPRALAGIATGAGASPGEVFFTVLSAGDELGVDAFLEMALAAAMHPEADFLYSDERCRNPASGEIEAFFKPQWSPDLMLSANYVGRLWCARVDLIRSVAEPTELLLGHGEYDLTLRCTEAATSVQHVAAVLCERAAEDCENPQQRKRALRRTLARGGIAGDIRDGLVPGTYRVKRTLTKPGLVSVIVPTGGNVRFLRTCVAGLFERTAYQNLELIILYNTMTRPEVFPYLETLAWEPRVRVIDSRGPFNFSRICNLGAAAARGEFLLFLNDDIEMIDPDWLGTLLEEAQRPEVGVVGPRLLYPDRRVQHAGIFLVAAIGHARHAFRYSAEDDPGYFGLSLTQRNVIAVTGACLLTRRETFDSLDGFDETQTIVNNDVDYCLRAWDQGWLIVYTPHATLIHHEAISRAALEDDYDVEVFDRKWRNLFLAGDPFFNPHLSKDHDDFAIDEEPTQLVVTGRPALPRDEIRKILIVKLDHIGDCVTALPAVRRLKQHFPKARMSVLTSRASKPVWALEPSIEQTIEFDFFHARSGLGELGLSQEDWRELRGRLEAERFDLAIDLRKHPETRPVLRHSGARYLAGFDFCNQFGWLDVALEWTGDAIRIRKRQHVADDLVNLVDAVAAAGESDRMVIATRRASTAPAVVALMRKTPSTGPLVCVHPTVGDDARQWPIEHFAAVIDRLVEADGARIVLIGGPDDDTVAADILSRVRHAKAVTSLVGKLPLADLPALLAEVALFVGNNSGPKHIAAGLGVPTVGIHSGTEDVREWGPVGPTAIAVVRSVACSPCYLSKAADCPRALACLRLLEPAQVYDACKRLLLAGPTAQPVRRPSGKKAQRTGSPARGAAHTAQRPARRVAQAGRR
ncbi:MAG TPA: glycosyltransferase family 9 protein [Stellaceae bacterium]|nr:glycosyltransferase family 9 protein [Stellaceae bacterium]